MKEQFKPIVNDLENIIDLKYHKHNECTTFIFSPKKKIIAPNLACIESIAWDPYEPTLKNIFANWASVASYIIEWSTALQNYWESVFLDQNSNDKSVVLITGEPNIEKNRQSLRSSLIRNFWTDIAKAVTIIVVAIITDVIVPPPWVETLIGIWAWSYYTKTAYNKVKFLLSSSDTIQFIYDPDLAPVEQAIAKDDNTQALEFLDEIDWIENQKYLEKYKFFAWTLSPKISTFKERALEGKDLLQEPTKKYFDNKIWDLLTRNKELANFMQVTPSKLSYVQHLVALLW